MWRVVSGLINICLCSHTILPVALQLLSANQHWWRRRPGVSFIKLSVDFILKVYVCTKASFLRTRDFFQIYKNTRTPEPAQKSLYKTQSGEKCAYVHLHPDSSPNHHIWSIQRLVLLCITSSAYHSYAYSYPRDTMFNTVKGTRH